VTRPRLNAASVLHLNSSFALQGNKLSAYSLTTVAIKFKRIIGLSPADYRRCFGIAAD
jgi:hypothetical protein